MTGKNRIRTDGWMQGMCYFSGKLYIGTGGTLQVYNVDNQDNITLLDTLHMPGLKHPRVDHQSGRVYIPYRGHGILVVKYDGSKLLRVRTMRCVQDVSSLAMVSPDTLYVCDNNSETVCLVDVTTDRVTQRLQRPQRVPQYQDNYVAFLGETLLVYHKNPSRPTLSSRLTMKLVIYRHGASTPGKVIPNPQGMDLVNRLTTDNHSSFLLIHSFKRSVYVLDISGDVTHTIPIITDSEPVACTVVRGKLWVGCSNGDIIVMSSL